MYWGVVTDYTNGKRITTTCGFSCRRPIIWGMKKRIADKNDKGVSVVGFDQGNPLKGLPSAEVIFQWSKNNNLALAGRACQKVWHVIESKMINIYTEPIPMNPIKVCEKECGNDTAYAQSDIHVQSPYQAYIVMPIILHLLYGVVNKLRALKEDKLKEIDETISDPKGEIPRYYEYLCDLPIWNQDAHQTKTRDALIKEGIQPFLPKPKDKDLLRTIWAEYGCVTTVDTFYYEKIAKKPYHRGWIEGEWKEKIEDIKK